MKKGTSTNIKYILDSYLNLESDSIDQILDYENIIIDRQELADINKLFVELEKLIDDIYIYDGYHIGYSIPQISKEFDLLRIGDECIINIEIKSKQIEKSSIKSNSLKIFII